MKYEYFIYPYIPLGIINAPNEYRQCKSTQYQKYIYIYSPLHKKLMYIEYNTIFSGSSNVMKTIPLSSLLYLSSFPIKHLILTYFTIYIYSDFRWLYNFSLQEFD